MRTLFSLKMEVRVWRVVAILLVIPVSVLVAVLIAGLAGLALGFDDHTVRIGMQTEQVRKILGDPDHIATLELPNGKLREDWWYSQARMQQKADLQQLTFEAGQLISNHSKNQLPR